MLTPQLLAWKYPELGEVRPLVTAQSDVDSAASTPTAAGGEDSTSMFIGVAVFCVIGVLLGFELIPRLFPKGAFLIGEGANRYKRVTTGRYVLIVALMVPLVISIARSVQ